MLIKYEIDFTLELIMDTSEHIDFITTLGREFSAVCSAAGVSDVSGQDCYSVIAEHLQTPVTLANLRALTQSQTTELSSAFNDFFECSVITPELISVAAQKTIRHWEP
jgi:hypothetical protein